MKPENKWYVWFPQQTNFNCAVLSTQMVGTTEMASLAIQKSVVNKGWNFGCLYRWGVNYE